MNGRDKSDLGTKEERDYYALNQRVYRVFAPFYDLVAFPIRKLRHEVARMTILPSGARVLDVATGTGAQAHAFAKTAKAVVGIDLSEAMLRIARRKNRFANVTFERADATELPFGDASFDAACISFALHEMPSSIRQRVVREMARVTKPGGSVIVVDYGLPKNRIGSWLAYHIVKLYERDHYASFVRSDLVGLLEDGGIELVRQRPAVLGLAQIVTGRRIEDARLRPAHGFRRAGRHHADRARAG